MRGELRVDRAVSAAHCLWPLLPRQAALEYNRNWQQARELIEKMKGGEDNGTFAYGFRSIPVDCYLILLARLQGEEPEENLSSAEAQEQLSQKVQKSPGAADLLSKLAVVDAVLGKKQDAITEVKRAAEMLPISRDAVNGPEIVKNLVVVYAWTGELEHSFEALVPLAKMPFGIDLRRFEALSALGSASEGSPL